MGNIKLNNSATANTVFNVTATLCLINNNEDFRKKQSDSKKGKIQSKAQIEKRLKNTNQVDKEIVS